MSHKIPSDRLQPGVEISVSGERGRFRILRFNADGSLATWGGRTGHARFRDFKISRVTRVHRPQPPRD